MTPVIVEHHGRRWLEGMRTYRTVKDMNHPICICLDQIAFLEQWEGYTEIGLVSGISLHVMASYNDVVKLLSEEGED